MITPPKVLAEAGELRRSIHAATAFTPGMSSPRPCTRGVPDGVADFRPRGVLVAHMADHQDSVNSVCVSASRSSWLASASSDGTVRLWGAARDGVQIDKVCACICAYAQT